MVDSNGIEYLIDAVAELADLAPALLLVGDGAMRPLLENQTRARGVRAVFRTSPVRNSEMSRIYCLGDVCVLPSVTIRAGRELWGLVVNEAMNLRLPVVVSSAVGAGESGLVRDGLEGRIVPKRDSRALAGALRQLPEDGDGACRLGAAGARRVAQFTHDRMAEAFVDAVAYAMAARRQ